MAHVVYYSDGITFSSAMIYSNFILINIYRLLQRQLSGGLKGFYSQRQRWCSSENGVPRPTRSVGQPVAGRTLGVVRSKWRG